MTTFVTPHPRYSASVAARFVRPRLSRQARLILSALAWLFFSAFAMAQTAAHSGGVMTTVGSGFTNPGGVAVDRAGNVFVADDGNNAVEEIVAVNGAVSSISTVNTVGSGFSDPSNVAVDGAGNVFVADYGNNAVKEIVAINGLVSSSSTVYTIGSGFSHPEGVAVDGRATSSLQTMATMR